MEIIQTIAFDITTPGITPRVYGKQGDAKSRMVLVNMYHGGEEWKIPSEAALAVRYKTPSGASGLYDTIEGETAILAENNQIMAVLATPIFAESGPTSCELVITDSVGATSTWKFLVVVEEASVSDTEIPEDYYNAFLGMAAEVKADADRAKEAADSIDTSLLMSKTMYDPDGAVKAAGGIPKYVAAQTLTGDYIPTSQKGAASGVATLGTDGKVPSGQLNMSNSISSSSTTTIANSAAVKTVNDKIPTLSSSVSSTSTTTAANSYAVKQAYDKAAAAAGVEVLTPTITCSDSNFSYSGCMGLKIGRLVMIYAKLTISAAQAYALTVNFGTNISFNADSGGERGHVFITPATSASGDFPSAYIELLTTTSMKCVVGSQATELNFAYFYMSGS